MWTRPGSGACKWEISRVLDSGVARGMQSHSHSSNPHVSKPSWVTRLIQVLLAYPAAHGITHPDRLS